MTLPHDTLILVADGRKALFLRNQGDEQQIDLRTISHREREDRKDSDIKTDAAGQSPAPAGSGLPGGTMDEPDFHQQEEDRFAAETADFLKKRAMAHEFDSLIIVAPPRTLGELRRHYHKEVTDRLIGEVGKDLTNLPVPEIEALLRGA